MRFGVQGVGIGIWCVAHEVRGGTSVKVGSVVEGLRFQVLGLGFRVSGLGFRVYV